MRVYTYMHHGEHGGIRDRCRNDGSLHQGNLVKRGFFWYDLLHHTRSPRHKHVAVQ